MKKNITKLPLFAIVGLLILSSFTAKAQKNELVIIDQAAEDIEVIISQFAREVNIYIIPSAGNPLDLITEALKTHQNTDVIHLFAMCKPGAIVFNQLSLLESELDQYNSYFEQWKKLLSPKAEIFIYGNNLAFDTEGKNMINVIAAKTGSVVRASSIGYDAEMDAFSRIPDFSSGRPEAKSIFEETNNQ